MAETPKIVVIDDEEDLCLVVKENLEETGKFLVETLSDPMKAEEFIRAQKPDVILLDVVMPQREGPDVMAALKRDPELKAIPVIIVSGKGEMVYNKKKDEFKWMPNSKLVQNRGQLPDVKGAEALAEAYQAVDYVSKPFTTEILVTVLEDVLGRFKKRASDSNDSGLVE
jgi:CheY-like chemotaxis protein